MRTLQILILFLFSGSLLAQSPKYSIEVFYNLYATGFDNIEYLYNTEQIKIKNSKKINQIIDELTNTKSISQLFAESKIDTFQIAQNPKNLIKYYDEKDITWNKQQVDFISNKLAEIKTYKENFAKYIQMGCCVHMHQRYRDEYVIKVYENDKLIDIYTSRKSRPNTRKIPWTDAEGKSNYNIQIDEVLLKLIGAKKKTQKTMSGKRLTKYLVKQIIDYHRPNLYELSAYDFYDELNELKTDFEILEIGEVFGRGRYIWNEPKTYYARLTNDLLKSQVNIMFLATKERKSIYSRDSLKADYVDIIKRVQNIDFLIRYIEANPSVQLDIYYFNNKPINEYNIDGFNKNPEQWIKHDKFLESIEKYKNIEPKPSSADEDAIRVSKQLYCGCNYRFDKEFAEKAVFIELSNKEKKENSIWYLLPDNTVLLYLMQGEKVLDYEYTEFGKFPGIQYPCALFDLKGNIIDKR